MFLLMRILCGLSRPPLRTTRTQPVPSGRAVAGSHCPAVRLDDLGKLRSDGSSEQGDRQSTNAAVSFDVFRADTCPPNPLTIAASAEKAPHLFHFVDFGGSGWPTSRGEHRLGPRAGSFLVSQRPDRLSSQQLMPATPPTPAGPPGVSRTV